MGGRLIMLMLYSRLAAMPGQRDALLDVLTEAAGTEGLPGCRMYIVAIDPDDADAVWVTEVWESQELHDASLNLEPVRERIGRAMPMIDMGGHRQLRLDALAGVPD
jgi:quinol monooxygenase YgiN